MATDGYEAKLKQANLMAGSLRTVGPDYPHKADAYSYMSQSRRVATNATDILLRRLAFSLDIPDRFLGDGNLPDHGFDFLQAHVPPSGDVVIFVAKGEESMILKDERSLFPSDTLIAQLRMAGGK